MSTFYDPSGVQDSGPAGVPPGGGAAASGLAGAAGLYDPSGGMTLGPASVPPPNGAALKLALHAVYVLSWAAGATDFLVGETRALAWAVARADGQPVDVPTSGTVTIVAPDGAPHALTPDLAGAGAVIQAVAAAEFAFALEGGHVARLSLTIGTQTVEHELLLRALAP